jgi:Bacterial SH3 domain
MSVADDKRAQIAGALGTMGYKGSVARDAASKLTDLDRPLPDLLRDGLRYAAGESPPSKAEPAKSKAPGGEAAGPSKQTAKDLDEELPALRAMLRQLDAQNEKERSAPRQREPEEKFRERTVERPRPREPDFRVSFGPSRSRSSKWTEAQKTYAALGVSGVVLAGLGAAFYFFVLRSDEAAPSAPASPGPHPPAHPPAAPGATLRVHTPHGQPGQLRAGPSKTAARTVEIPNGTPAHVLESTTTAGSVWYRIDAGQGRVGWMHGDILQGST